MIGLFPFAELPAQVQRVWSQPEIIKAPQLLNYYNVWNPDFVQISGAKVMEIMFFLKKFPHLSYFVELKSPVNVINETF
mgnify:CR=1 FL=1